MHRQESVIVYIFAVLAVLALAVPAVAQSSRSGAGVQPNTVELASIVARMEQAQLSNRAHYRAYTLTRQYRFYSDKEKPDAQVIADIDFVPPDQKTFNIESAEGSERHTSIVRRLLESESQAAASGKAPGAITTQNYDFSLLGEDSFAGQPCWVLGVHARREDRDLINGTILVDKNTYLVHRMDGDLSKTPSWWLKKVHVTIDFADAGGMWLQTQTHAVADVRMLGQHTFIAQAVKIQTSDEVAQVERPANPRAGNGGSIAGVRTSRQSRHPQTPAPPLFGAGIAVRP